VIRHDTQLVRQCATHQTSCNLHKTLLIDIIHSDNSIVTRVHPVVIAGTVAVLAVYILQQPALDTMDIGNGLEWFFYVLLPNYCFNKGLQNMYTNYQYGSICKLIDKAVDRTTFCTFIEANNATSFCCSSEFNGSLTLQFNIHQQNMMDQLKTSCNNKFNVAPFRSRVTCVFVARHYFIVARFDFLVVFNYCQ